MNKLILVLLLFLCFNSIAQNDIDSPIYLCKYSFDWQKDSTDLFSKSNDKMYLEIGKNSSTFYSNNHLTGYLNFLEDLKARRSIDYVQANAYRYYKNSETEIIIHNFETKEFKVIDKLSATTSGITYCYFDSVENPIWKLEPDTLTILNQLCQKASATFKGRDYIAWFAPDIPYSLGPWQFTGLPGLILKINDTKNQITFVAIEIGNDTPSKVTEIEYPNCLPTEKSKVRKLRKLKAQNSLAFEKIQHPNLTFTFRNNAGEIIQPSNKLRPYNPIDLSK